MLCLSGQVGDRIAILHEGELVGYVQLISIQNKYKVRLGFEFHNDLDIVREKLLDENVLPPKGDS